MNRIYTILILSLLALSCDNNKKAELTDIEQWNLCWKMRMSVMDKNYDLALLQFDSLLSTNSKIDNEFLGTGLDIMVEKNLEGRIQEILENQDQETLAYLCSQNIFTQSLEDIFCKTDQNSEKVSHPELQYEIIKMLINDQLARGSNEDHLIAKYNFVKEEIIQHGVSTDTDNRNRLKEIFSNFGFPTKKMVGKDAMKGVFLIIQHSDQDKQWQKSQFDNIEKAVKKGDLDGDNYAYLYDRIKINSGEKQLYGTQISKVDRANKTVELAETEDLANLDRRRMEMRMMPIEIYKSFMLKPL